MANCGGQPAGSDGLFGDRHERLKGMEELRYDARVVGVREGGGIILPAASRLEALEAPRGMSLRSAGAVQRRRVPALPAEATATVTTPE